MRQAMVEEEGESEEGWEKGASTAQADDEIASSLSPSLLWTDSRHGLQASLAATLFASPCLFEREREREERLPSLPAGDGRR